MSHFHLETNRGTLDPSTHPLLTYTLTKTFSNFNFSHESRALNAQHEETPRCLLMVGRHLEGNRLTAVPPVAGLVSLLTL